MTKEVNISYRIVICQTKKLGKNLRRNTEPPRSRKHKSKRKATLQKRVADTSSTAHSAFHRATFADGSAQAREITDQGPDVNIIPRKLFDDLFKRQLNVKCEEIHPARAYEGITGETRMECNTSGKLDVHLKLDMDHL